MIDTPIKIQTADNKFDHLRIICLSQLWCDVPPPTHLYILFVFPNASSHTSPSYHSHTFYPRSTISWVTTKTTVRIGGRRDQKDRIWSPPPDTPIPRRSPRRPAKPPTIVSNQKRVLLKFDDSLLAKKGVDDDTAVLSSKKARGVTSETSTVCKDTLAPDSSTQNFEQILSLIASTPEIEQILRKKYRPVMHSTPPGGESRALFLHLDRYNGFHKSPEPDSISVSSSDGPPSGSNDIEPQDES